MKLWITTVLIAVMTVINIGTLVLNTSGTVQAAVAGMGWTQLRRDYDFKKAVRNVVEQYCEADDDGDIDC